MLVPTMMIESRTSWRKVWAIQATGPSPPLDSAAGRPTRARMQKSQAQVMLPTPCVIFTASQLLTRL